MITSANSCFLQVEHNLVGRRLSKGERTAMAHEIVTNQQVEALVNLHNFLAKKREILLHLLENPNLLEHESFTDLLWAVFHLSDELCRAKLLRQFT